MLYNYNTLIKFRNHMPTIEIDPFCLTGEDKPPEKIILFTQIAQGNFLPIGIYSDQRRMGSLYAYEVTISNEWDKLGRIIEHFRKEKYDIFYGGEPLYRTTLRDFFESLISEDHKRREGIYSDNTHSGSDDEDPNPDREPGEKFSGGPKLR